jgi:tetratricopeptide (TPR) repeat protein
MYEEAIQDYTQALQADQSNLHYLHNRGICYQKIHEYQKAVQDFTEEIKLLSCPTSYFFRGYCYDSMG